MSPLVRLIVGIVLVLIAVGAAVWFFLLPDRTPPEEAPVEPMVVEPAPTPTPTTQERLSERLKGVSLATSDEAVRELVAALSSRPELVEWLANEDLVRRFVAATHNVANGKSPRAHLGFLAPEGGFAVLERPEGLTVRASTWQRYDTVAAVVDGIDVPGARELFVELEPLVDEAHREIAPPGSEFRDVLRRAIDHLLATPVPTTPVYVEQKVLTYVFADPTLENLSEAQRHLVRMGPDNQRVVQAKLAALREALDL